MTKDKQVSTDRIISRSEFRERTCISRTSEFEMARRGLLPTMVVVGNRKLGYLESAFEDWLKANSK